MNIPGFSAVLKTALLISILLISSGLAHAQKSGAHYWGDADGNGIIEVPDLIALNTVLGNFANDDTVNYNGYPQSRYRQDLDGNGIIEVPDLILLNGWLGSTFDNRPGNPDRLFLNGSSSINLNLGDSVAISAYAISPLSMGSQVRTGFGVIFKIDPSGNCTTAQIKGYDVAGGATVNLWRNPAAYHYTLLPGAPDNGNATVKVNTNGCSLGQTIVVEVYIPADSESGAVAGRFPDKLSASQNFTITVTSPSPPDTTITSKPPDPSNNSNPSFEFTCDQEPCTYKCKLDAGSTVDCASPKDYSGLADGSHTFKVQAINSSLIPDPTPAAYTWNIDTVAPIITIVAPPGGITTDPNISIYITYSDANSGIDLSSLAVYHNDTDITSLLTKDGTHATGSRTGTMGGNVFNATISDLAGNQWFAASLRIVDDNRPPQITIISPPVSGTSNTDTPQFKIEYADTAGIDINSLVIIIDGINMTSLFTISGTGALWWPDYHLINGAHSWSVFICDQSTPPNCTTANPNFNVNNQCTNFSISQVDPNFTIGGDSVTITGSNFDANVNVVFTTTLGTIKVRAWNIIPGMLVGATVPGSVITGEVRVESPADSGCISNLCLPFTAALPYAYIANRQSNNVSVINYTNNQYVTSITIPGASPTPYAADVSPDGRWVVVANYNTNNATIIDTLDNTVRVENATLVCGSGITNPQAIAISPDGSRAFVASKNKFVTSMEIRRKLITGDTCSSVKNQSYTQGSQFWDIDFSPDGKRAVIVTDYSGTAGKVYSIDSSRYYIVDGNSNDYYLQDGFTTLGSGPESNAQRNPYGLCMLPQKLSTTSGYPWGTIIVNKGTTSDTNEDSVWLDLSLTLSPVFAYHNIITTNLAGHPNCYGGVDATVSNLGERAFIGFTASNNIGVTGSLQSIAPDILAASSVNYYVGNLREVAYTPYYNKVLATIFYITDWHNSRVMVLNASDIPMGYTGTIYSTSYTSIQDASMVGPEGIGLQPLFDRDSDGISDLIEATNQDAGTVTVNFRPTIFDIDPSIARGTPSNGSLSKGILLPEEGPGFRHFYGTTTDFKNPLGERWGTLSLIKIIEAVGREWNMRHPSGPRISINDMSRRTGGEFFWYVNGVKKRHRSHYNGQDADLRYVRSDGSEAGYDFNNDPPPYNGYSQSNTQELVDLFCKIGVKKIFVDKFGATSRANLSAPPGCTISSVNGHNNHFHIRIVNQ